MDIIQIELRYKHVIMLHSICRKRQRRFRERWLGKRWRWWWQWCGCNGKRPYPVCVTPVRRQTAEDVHG